MIRITDAARAFGAEILITSSEVRATGRTLCRGVGNPRRRGNDRKPGDALTPPWFLEKLVEGLRADKQAAIATPILRCDGGHACVESRPHRWCGWNDDNRCARCFSKEVVLHYGARFTQPFNACVPPRERLCLPYGPCPIGLLVIEALKAGGSGFLRQGIGFVRRG
jgi:hypothetical protein